MVFFIKFCTGNFLSLSLLTSVWIVDVGAINPTYLYHFCSNATINNSTTNSIYRSNLNTLLSSLSTNATREFYNASAGGIVYGLFLCRGDVSATTCRDCVTFSVKDVVQRCPTEEMAVLWYDECELRYSNSSFFGTVATRPTASRLSSANVTDQDRFNQLLNDTMKEAAAEVARGGPGEKKFATRQADFNEFQTLYNLVQCTADLSGEDCGRCLTEAIGNLPTCCDGKQGGRVLFPSCNIRYEFYPFYSQNTSSPPPTASSPVPPPPTPGSTEGESKISSLTIVAIVVPISVCILAFTLIVSCFLRKRSKEKYNAADSKNDGDITTIESLQFHLTTLEVATNKFSADNKLGEGGFDEVYKGTLHNEQQIAVKRLSKSSGQGAQELKNEVVLLANLQHRNLVRLLGFCLEGEETLLVYEFVPNKSLDYFLYDPDKQRQLDWSRHHKIIGGIARGILYLHEDSQLKIIHRDLKASIILLDDDMNPKISDFEYAMHGQFSIKSNVYSFGVLILEIISGKKNSKFYQEDSADDLLCYAWKLWKEGTPLRLLDPTLAHSYSENEVVRCIHVGLLCVQEDPEDRPSMKTIVLMFNSYSVTLPVPEKPAFYNRTEVDMPALEMKFEQSASSAEIPLSVNEASITEPYPR